MEKEPNAKEIFNQWVSEVVELRYTKLRGKMEREDIYSCIELTDAKINFLDGVPASEYKFSVY
jgi:hypothetical protein